MFRHPQTAWVPIANIQSNQRAAVVVFRNVVSNGSRVLAGPAFVFGSVVSADLLEPRALRHDQAAADYEHRDLPRLDRRIGRVFAQPDQLASRRNGQAKGATINWLGF